MPKNLGEILKRSPQRRATNRGG